MAASLIFRIALMLGPVGFRVVQSLQTGGARSIDNALRTFKEPLQDASVSPTDLTASMRSMYGEEITVTDWSGSFECRKLQWRFSRAPTGGTVEDVDVITQHFLKVTGGNPGAWNDVNDTVTVENAMNTCWTAIKTRFPSFMKSDQYRFYKDGPAYWQPGGGGYTGFTPIPGNAAVKVTEVDDPGTGVSGTQLPPQVAVSVTKQCSSRPHWGRFYLPAVDSGSCDSMGRVGTGAVDAFANAFLTAYSTCRAAGVYPIIFSAPKASRANAQGVTLPAQEAMAFEITAVKVDNLFDVIRSRRYAAKTYEKRNVIT